MNHKKHHLLVATLAILSSCANTESYQQKMARYNPKTAGKNQVPEIKTAELQFKPVAASTSTQERVPASTPESKNANAEGKEINPTNKRLYFLNLLSEYEDLKKYSHDFSGPNITICPNFHTALLRHNEKTTTPDSNTTSKNKNFTYDSKRYSDDFYVAGRPELLLPLSKEEIAPKIIDIIKSSKEAITDATVNELVHKALDIHLAKTYSEIRELCEYGVSDNYYIYENLITHIKNNKFEANNKNMNTLLKTTVFSNLAIVTSLEKQNKPSIPTRAISSITNDNKNYPYANDMIVRLNVTWANQYFDFIKKSN